MPDAPLKIGFVLDDGLDSADGVQQYVLTLSSWLTRQGHEVHYLVGQTKRTDIAHIHSLARNVTVRFNQNKMSIPLPAPERPIRQLLQTEQFDVLHVQMPYNPLLASRIIRATSDQTAIVGTFHILPFSWLESVATKLLRIWLGRTLKRFDAVMSVSAPARAFALDALRVDSVVVPNAVDAGVLRPKVSPSKKTIPSIVFVGRLVNRKGCLHLLRALAQVRAQSPDTAFQLTICGKGALEPELRSFVAHNKLDSHVTFAGFVTEEQKTSYLAEADLAVFPSTGGESFGIVLIEAMAAGSGVVIGGNNPGYASVLADDRVLVDPTDTIKFAEMIKTILDDPKLSQSIHAAQQSRVNDYDIATVGPRVVETYRQAVAKRTLSKHNG